MSDCIFCQICSGQQEAELLYQDEDLVAFKDINPSAPIHLLIVPCRHIKSVNELEPRDQKLVGKMFLVAKQMAQREGIADRGYKLMFNVGRDGGQVIDHLHLHLLGGKRFSEN